MSVLAIDIWKFTRGAGGFYAGKVQGSGDPFASWGPWTGIWPRRCGISGRPPRRNHVNGDDESGLVISSVVPELTRKIQQAIVAAKMEEALQVVGKRFCRSAENEIAR